MHSYRHLCVKVNQERAKRTFHVVSAIPTFFSYNYSRDSRLYPRRERKKSRGASEEMRRDNALSRSRVHLSAAHFTSVLPRRRGRGAYSRRVFDKFAEFYGSIYGNGGNATGRCSSCQITRIPVSLIGRSYAEERRSNATPVGDTFALTTSNYVFLSPRGYNDTSTTLISPLLLPAPSI